jgi:hypothetical protein
MVLLFYGYAVLWWCYRMVVLFMVVMSHERASYRCAIEWPCYLWCYCRMAVLLVIYGGDIVLRCHFMAVISYGGAILCLCYFMAVLLYEGYILWRCYRMVVISYSGIIVY